MDHHCVWIGKCVGLHNMKPFLLFLGHAVITCTYSFILCFIEFMRCEVLDNNDSCHANESPYHILMVFNRAVAIFGMIFTFAMGFFTLAVLVA